MSQQNNEQPATLPLSSLMGESPFRLEDKGSYLKLTLHGFFSSVDENTKIVEDLYEASSHHNSVEVWINSEGGQVSLLIEIIEALKQFETVVTICNSSAFSAGAMLWSFGDIRVSSPYATIGFHRESYGFYGKTDQHSDLLDHQKKIYPILLEETCGHILSESEKEKARMTELYFTGKDMIDGKHAISYDDYRNCDGNIGSRLSPLGTVFVDQERGTLIMVDEMGRGRHISAIQEQSPYEFMLYDYILSNKVRVLYDHNEEFVREDKDDFDETVERFYQMLEDSEEDDQESSEEDQKLGFDQETTDL